jgi:conserved oligomeric Golgi complex subunit 6
MSEVGLQGQVNAPPHSTVSESVDTSSQAEPEAPHGEHEVELEKPLENTLVEESATDTAQEDGGSKTNGMEHSQSDDILAVDDVASPPADEANKEEPTAPTDSGKSKSAISVKVTGDKSAGPPTPLVKKVCSASQILPSC